MLDEDGGFYPQRQRIPIQIGDQACQQWQRYQEQIDSVPDNAASDQDHYSAAPYLYDFGWLNSDVFYYRLLG